MGGIDAGGYYGRSWGDHPDMHAFDLHSQASALGGGGGGGGGRKGGQDSRFDSRYADTASQDDSLRSQYVPTLYTLYILLIAAVYAVHCAALLYGGRFLLLFFVGHL